MATLCMSQSLVHHFHEIRLFKSCKHTFLIVKLFIYFVLTGVLALLDDKINFVVFG